MHRKVKTVRPVLKLKLIQKRKKPGSRFKPPVSITTPAGEYATLPGGKGNAKGNRILVNTTSIASFQTFFVNMFDKFTHFYFLTVSFLESPLKYDYNIFCLKKSFLCLYLLCFIVFSALNQSYAKTYG